MDRDACEPRFGATTRGEGRRPSPRVVAPNLGERSRNSLGLMKTSCEETIPNLGERSRNSLGLATVDPTKLPES